MTSKKNSHQTLKSCIYQDEFTVNCGIHQLATIFTIVGSTDILECFSVVKLFIWRSRSAHYFLLSFPGDKDFQLIFISQPSPNIISLDRRFKKAISTWHLLRWALISFPMNFSNFALRFAHKFTNYYRFSLAHPKQRNVNRFTRNSARVKANTIDGMSSACHTHFPNWTSTRSTSHRKKKIYTFSLLRARKITSTRGSDGNSAGSSLKQLFERVEKNEKGKKLGRKIKCYRGGVCATSCGEEEVIEKRAKNFARAAAREAAKKKLRKRSAITRILKK